MAYLGPKVVWVFSLHFFNRKLLSAPLAGEWSTLACSVCSTPAGLIILVFLINHVLTGVFFAASFACLSVLLVSFFCRRSGENLKRCRLGWEKPREIWPITGVQSLARPVLKPRGPALKFDALPKIQNHVQVILHKVKSRGHTTVFDTGAHKYMIGRDGW